MAGGSALPREVLEVLWDGERLRGRLDGRLLFSASAGEMDRVLKPVAGGRWEISVWGGEATIARSRMLEVP